MSCKLRPVPLTYYNVVGELKRELGGINLCKVFTFVVYKRKRYETEKSLPLSQRNDQKK